MIPLLVLQTAVPLVLIAWIGIAPPRNRLGFGLQLLGSAAVLFAIALTGLWALPPWWAPYGLGGLFLLATVAGLRRIRPLASELPSGAGSWIVAGLFLAVGAVATVLGALALAGRSPPSGRIVDLAYPLESGTYLVVNGGAHLSINAHMKTLDPAIPGFRAARGQSYGVDFVKLDRLGLRADGLRPAEPRAYYAYGATVLAPCAGQVIAAVDGLPDMRVPRTDRTKLAGNHVMLRCGHIDILLAHLRPGSVTVTVGSQVNAGDSIGQIGNSGNSDEPHLHIHAQAQGSADAPMSGDPLPIRFDGRILVRNDRITVP